MVNKITYDDLAIIDKRIESFCEEINEMEKNGASEDELNEKHAILGNAVIARDIAEERFMNDLSEEEREAYEEKKAAKRLESLERRLELIEKQIEYNVRVKAELDETIANSERVIELIDKTIKAADNQTAALS